MQDSETQALPKKTLTHCTMHSPFPDANWIVSVWTVLDIPIRFARRNINNFYFCQMNSAAATFMSIWQFEIDRQSWRNLLFWSVRRVVSNIAGPIMAKFKQLILCNIRWVDGNQWKCCFFEKCAAHDLYVGDGVHINRTGQQFLNKCATDESVSFAAR